MPEWEESIKELANKIYKEQSINSVKASREALVKLIINGIPPKLVFYKILKLYVSNQSISDDVKIQIVNWASFYENR